MNRKRMAYADEFYTDTTHEARNTIAKHAWAVRRACAEASAKFGALGEVRWSVGRQGTWYVEATVTLRSPFALGAYSGDAGVAATQIKAADALMHEGMIGPQVWRTTEEEREVRVFSPKGVPRMTVCERSTSYRAYFDSLRGETFPAAAARGRTVSLPPRLRKDAEPTPVEEAP